MPEYLAPGVYVEEVSFRAKSIEGVSTTTTGFIGPARFGPINGASDVITSLGEFERVYGDRQQLSFDPLNAGSSIDNYLWHGVRAFFEEGGKRLYVVRVFTPYTPDPHNNTRFIAGEYQPPTDNPNTTPAPAQQNNLYADGHARFTLGTGNKAILIRSRFPGAAGNMRVRLTLRVGQNVLSMGKNGNSNTVSTLLDNDVVLLNQVTSPTSPLTASTAHLATSQYDTTTKTTTWQFSDDRSPANVLSLAWLKDGDYIRPVTLTVTVFPQDPNALPQVWDNLPLDPDHQRANTPDSFTSFFSDDPGDSTLAQSLPIVIKTAEGTSGLDVLDTLVAVSTAEHGDILAALDAYFASDAPTRKTSTDIARSVEVTLSGGHDGMPPAASEYEGRDEEDKNYKTGLKAFEDIDDISIIAAPGSTYGMNGDQTHPQTINAETIMSNLIVHAALMRYRIAVLDSGEGMSIKDVRALRARFDSTYAALYYPWIKILDPVTQREILMPPSSFVTGIYARNDTNRAVYKAPANEVVNLALGFEVLLNKSQQEVLNPEGINCFRFFEGRGFRLWGARTISSDPEWKYVNLRRYFAYLEHSIDKGTQWAVFEPNGEALWANVRRTIEDFLLNEWQSGALLGDRPEKAYFVRCDRSTMTQNDLDNGRLICLIGVAPLRPAEFVIFRIGQQVVKA